MKIKNQKAFQHQQGFIAFTSLLVISAVTLAIAISVVVLGINSANSSLSLNQSKKAQLISESCLENGLQRLKNNASYSGEPLNLDGVSCVITVTGTASDKVISVQATYNAPPKFTYNIVANVKRTGNSINILSVNRQ